MPTEPSLDLYPAPFGTDKKTGQPNIANPTQQKVLEWVDNIRQNPVHEASNDGKGIPILYLEGGAGSGKTRAFLAPIIECLTEIPGLRVLWGRHDYADLRVSAMETFFEVLPPRLLIDKNAEEHRYVIGQSDGGKSQIFFKGLKDIAGLGSQEFGIIVITEAYENTEREFITLKMRCRQSGMPLMILMEGNPPNETHWLYRFTDPTNEQYDTDIEKWTLSSYENWKNLDPRYRNTLERMPLAWRKKYLEGKPGFMPDGTPFYDGVVEDQHAGEFEWKGQELLLGWDYGYQHPACHVSYLDDFGRWIHLREFIGTETLIDAFASHVHARLNLYYPDFRCKLFGDPAGKQQSDKSKEVSEAYVAKEFGGTVYSRPSNTSQANYEARKLIIEGKLHTIIGGMPALLIDKRHCRFTLDGFLGGYHYPKRDPNKPVTGNPDAPYRDGFYEHIMNAMEYTAVNIFSPMRRSRTEKPKAYRNPNRRLDNI